jgi:AcrR family transcriptional regulator
VRARREPTQERSRERVARILDATAAILDEHGLEAVNTNAIAKRARVPVGSVYQFFPNRDAILEALAEAGLAKLDAHFVPLLASAKKSADARAIVRAVLRALRDAYVSIPGLAALVGSTSGHPKLERIYGANNALVASHVRAMLLHVNPALKKRAAPAATVVVETADAIVRHWLRARLRGDAPGNATIEELEDMLATYLERLAAARKKARS